MNRKSGLDSDPKPKAPPRPRRPKPGIPSKVLTFGLLSLASFVAALVLVWLMVAKAELLGRLGLSGRLYYLVLLPLGLSVAAFLFGAMSSYAHYRGKTLGGVLELGGPVVVFCLVVIGGFWLVPPQEPFALMVFVHGEGGVQEIPLRNQGAVLLDLGADRRRQPIGDKGEAYFPGIPAHFRGQEVAIGLEAEGFAPAPGPTHQRLDGEALYLAVQRLPVSLRGRVQDAEGQPIGGAALRLGELTAVSQTDGTFVIAIPDERAAETPMLHASAPGYEPWEAEVVPGSNAVGILLRRASE